MLVKLLEKGQYSADIEDQLLSVGLPYSKFINKRVPFFRYVKDVSKHTYDKVRIFLTLPKELNTLWKKC